MLNIRIQIHSFLSLKSILLFYYTGSKGNLFYLSVVKTFYIKCLWNFSSYGFYSLALFWQLSLWNGFHFFLCIIFYRRNVTNSFWKCVLGTWTIGLYISMKVSFIPQNHTCRDCFLMCLLHLGVSVTLSWFYSVPWFLYLVRSLYDIWTRLHPQHPLLLRQRYLQVSVISRSSEDSEVILWNLDNSVKGQGIQFALGNQVPSLLSGAKILYPPTHIHLNCPNQD